MMGPKCKICRRLETKLFLKGERCFGQKCEIIKRNYPPGIRNKKRGRKISDYGKGFMEKQKLKRWYNLSEEQFSSYVKAILAKQRTQKKMDTRNQLIRGLESRLDNVVYRMGVALSRSEARQLVNHGHFTVNGRKVDIPSCMLKEGDEIEIKHTSKEKSKIQGMKELLKRYNPPEWLLVDKETMKSKVIRFPTAEEAGIPVETSNVFEFYSK